MDRKTAQVIQIEPDYQWAQSQHTIYLEIKFGPRFSAPASCLEFKADDRSVTLEEDNMLVVKASCFHDGLIRAFELRLELEQRVIAPLYSIEDLNPGEDDASLEHFTMGTGMKKDRA